jgi:hypothetical protein
MSVFKLAKEHPLTNAGLDCVYVVEKAELGLRPGDIVFEFPFGRIVDTGMACRREGIIPPAIDLMTVHKEATVARAAHKGRARVGLRPGLREFAGAQRGAGDLAASLQGDEITPIRSRNSRFSTGGIRGSGVLFMSMR